MAVKKNMLKEIFERITLHNNELFKQCVILLFSITLVTSFSHSRTCFSVFVHKTGLNLLRLQNKTRECFFLKIVKILQAVNNKRKF